ncbi:hypothetical protein VTO42DRAFT_1534 [Malbranchea cinnamomea]
MESPRRFYLITQPRTASNLLVKILGVENLQPEVQHGGRASGYWFMDAASARWTPEFTNRSMEEWTDEEKTRIRQGYQKAFDDFEAFLEKAEINNKIVFSKEHAFVLGNPATQWREFFAQRSALVDAEWVVKVPEKYAKSPTWSEHNKTILPDEFLRTFKPIFLIRHPAIAFPSFYRAALDVQNGLGGSFTSDQKSVLTFWHIRKLYDWYEADIAKSGSAPSSSGQTEGHSTLPWPVVIDADDIIRDPEAMANKLCEIVGLDKTKLQFEWEPDTGETVLPGNELFNKAARRMMSTLRASTGILKEKLAANIDIDAEAKKWKEEFGEEEGADIERRVREAIPDYEYLKARKLQV